MRPISDSLYDLLVSQGISAGPGATSRAHGMKGRAAASDGARSQSRQREDAADLNSGKTGSTKPPASFQEVGKIVSQEPSMARSHPVPHIVVDNSRCKPIRPHTRVAPRGIGFHLVLIEGGRK